MTLRARESLKHFFDAASRNQVEFHFTLDQLNSEQRKLFLLALDLFQSPAWEEIHSLVRFKELGGEKALQRISLILEGKLTQKHQKVFTLFHRHLTLKSLEKKFLKVFKQNEQNRMPHLEKNIALLLEQDRKVAVLTEAVESLDAVTPATLAHCFNQLKIDRNDPLRRDLTEFFFSHPNLTLLPPEDLMEEFRSQITRELYHLEREVRAPIFKQQTQDTLLFFLQVEQEERDLLKELRTKNEENLLRKIYSVDALYEFSHHDFQESEASLFRLRKEKLEAFKEDVLQLKELHRNGSKESYKRNFDLLVQALEGSLKTLRKEEKELIRYFEKININPDVPPPCLTFGLPVMQVRASTPFIIKKLYKTFFEELKGTENEKVHQVEQRFLKELEDEIYLMGEALKRLKRHPTEIPQEFDHFKSLQKARLENLEAEYALLSKQSPLNEAFKRRIEVLQRHEKNKPSLFGLKDKLELSYAQKKEELKALKKRIQNYKSQLR